MSEINATRLTALLEVIRGLCPGLSLSLAEELNLECLIEPETVISVPLPELLNSPESVVNTVFSLSQPFSAESILILADSGATAMSKILASSAGAAGGETLSEADVNRVGKALNGLLRGFAQGLTNLLGDTVELESSSTSRASLVLPPVFALEDAVLQVNLILTLPEVPDAELKFLLTPEILNELTPELEESTDGDGTGLSEDELAAMLSELEGGEEGEAAAPASTLEASPFGSLEARHQEIAPRGIELIMDIPLEVTVELGRVRMLIRDVLELASGSIVELDRMAGEPVDLLVNGRLIAKGEVVVIEDNFGLRLTEIVSPADRVAGLSKKRAA